MKIKLADKGGDTQHSHEELSRFMIGVTNARTRMFKTEAWEEDAMGKMLPQYNLEELALLKKKIPDGCRLKAFILWRNTPYQNYHQLQVMIQDFQMTLR